MNKHGREMDNLREELESNLRKRKVLGNKLVEAWGKTDIGWGLEDIAETNPQHARNIAFAIQMQESYMKKKWKKLEEAIVSSDFAQTPENLLKVIRLGVANSNRGKIFTEWPLTSTDDAIYIVDRTYEQSLRGATAGEKIYENMHKYYPTTTTTQSLGTGDGATTQFTSTISTTPVVKFTVRILSNGAYIGVDDGVGTIVGDALNSSSTNTIDYTTGDIEINFTTPPVDTAPVLVEYAFDSENSSNYASFGTVGINVIKHRFNAYPNPLGYHFSDMSAITLETTGLGDIHDMLIEAVADEHAKARDYRAIGFGRQVSKQNTITTFDSDFATAGEVSDKSHAQRILSTIDDIGGDIYDDIKRGSVTTAVAGSRALTYLKKHDLWKTDTGGQPKWGCYQAGRLDDILVFSCPQDADVILNNEVLLTYKNDSDVNDLSIVFGNLTEISAELRFPEFYTKGNLATIEDKIVVEPKFLRLLQITNLSS
ncbi:MAG: DUF2460 domain-containing protein [PVC group bacterium]|nr:DUF2460 domain-containing protein [PVC group bacterium]